MKFTFRVYEQGAPAGQAPLMTPLTIELGSVQIARAKARELTSTITVRALAVDIDSEDGTISERWYRHLSGWERGDTHRT